MTNLAPGILTRRDSVPQAGWRPGGVLGDNMSNAVTRRPTFVAALAALLGVSALLIVANAGPPPRGSRGVRSMRPCRPMPWPGQGPHPRLRRRAPSTDGASPSVTTSRSAGTHLLRAGLDRDRVGQHVERRGGAAAGRCRRRPPGVPPVGDLFRHAGPAWRSVGTSTPRAPPRGSSSSCRNGIWMPTEVNLPAGVADLGIQRRTRN